ncbi:hypothetical protein LTR56_003148 [Elasticomyces elasticus]|nr:hypothetical protein LTR22_010681 [Elasticomyces elasticus]KAK3656017.1 hypothetical protein LTR56_003148 [Elasticomyces elasticus]KAK4920921.1 hypothetical protein LTR49_011644 [Elasticomyces elasticus]KAK5759563.1 hypothetical protein LTS12_010255 [Elasticomyces elasticus]
MCQLETLHYACCDRTEDPAKAVLKFCAISDPVDADDWRTGKREPCKSYKRHTRTETVNAQFCCSEACCSKLLAPFHQGVVHEGKSIDIKIVSKLKGLHWGKHGKYSNMENKALERAQAEHEQCKERREKFYAPQVFTDEDLEARDYYLEPITHAMGSGKVNYI